MIAGNFEAEALVAVTGVLPTEAPSDVDIAAAQRYPVRLKKRIDEFLNAKQKEPLKWKKPPKQRQLRAQLTESLESLPMHEWLESHDAATFGAYMLVLSAARKYLNDAWPVYPVDNSLQIENHDLALDEYYDYWRLVRIAEDPEVIFDDMDALVLLPEQVTCLQAVYPAIYDTIAKLMNLSLQSFVKIPGEDKPKKSLSWRRESQVRVLLRLTEDEPLPIVEQQDQQPQSKPGPSAVSKARDEVGTPQDQTMKQRLAK
jgi:hypothetical protein